MAQTSTSRSRSMDKFRRCCLSSLKSAITISQEHDVRRGDVLFAITVEVAGCNSHRVLVKRDVGTELIAVTTSSEGALPISQVDGGNIVARRITKHPV